MRSLEFIEKYAQGRVAESAITRWLTQRGNFVLPVYETGEDAKKGPQLFGQLEQFIAPDMLVLPQATFIEAKNKSAFTWHRKTERWTTGIDRKHYHEYFQVQDRTSVPVWLLFLHTNSQPSKNDQDWGCPDSCPVGLFGQSLSVLSDNVNHESPLWGRSGMIYWAHETLRLLARIEDVPF